MLTALMQKTPMTSVFWASKNNRILHNVFLAILGSFILTLSAKIAIPLQPINLTMQSLAVLFVGMAFGWRLGGVTVLLYLAVGAMGIPVFTSQVTGSAIFAGPCGGYLIGMVPAAMVSGYLVERGWGRTNFTAALAALLGTIVIYLFGLIHLLKLANWHTVVTYGLYPFLFVDLLKILFMTFLIPLMWKPKQNNKNA